MPDRPPIHDTLMRVAYIMATRGTCNRKQVGAVIAKDTRIISTGYVGSPSGQPHCTEAGCIIGPDGGCIRTLHAETNAIAFAAKNGLPISGSTLYVTLAPCLPCAKLIVSAGIHEVYYYAEYRDMSGVEYLMTAGVKVCQSR